MKNILSFIDMKLNALPMYRVVLYGLLGLQGVAVVFGFLHLLPYSGSTLLAQALVLYVVSFTSNALFAKVVKAAPNTESVYISAAILFFLLWPLSSPRDLLVTALIAILAMGSKFVFAVRRVHLFNPAAIAVLLIGLMNFGVVSWWAGSINLLPFMSIVGFVITRKIRREEMVASFIGAAVLSISLQAALRQEAVADILYNAVASGPLVFFATVMLTEPLTTPPTKKLQRWYGILAGVVYGVQFQVGRFYSSPELTLLIANVWSFFVSQKQRVLLSLVEKKTLDAETFDFIFEPSSPVDFKAGQYLEWTVPHQPTDDRGNRRYFTIASSPTEKTINLGVKIPATDMSSFKKALAQLRVGETVIANQLGGDFVLPNNAREKLVFITGGIGVTPFRSMVKFLMDKNEQRDIVFLYVAATVSGFVYREVFELAKKVIGLRCVYILSDAAAAPTDWSGKVGHITAEMLRGEVPDFSQRLFYVSGPQRMVDGCKSVLREIQVPDSRVLTDYFPGY